MNICAYASVASRAMRCARGVSRPAHLKTRTSPNPNPVRSLSTRNRDLPPHGSTNASKAQTSKQPSPSRTLQEQKISTPPPPNEQKSARERRKPRNEEIKCSYVRLVNPETGALDPPARVSDVLARIDRKHQFLELVSETPEPIVKIHDKKLLYDRERTRKLVQATKKPPEEKEVQLTWGVGAGDMQFKLKKVRAELEEGNRVNLVFAPKKGQTVPSPAEQEQIVQTALDHVADVGKERMAREVQKQAVALFLETLRPKRTVELRWTSSNNDSWEGLKAVEAALRSRERVEAIFVLPPPPKKEKNMDPSGAHDVGGVDPAVARERVERTLRILGELGSEYKPRDVRKAIIIAHLDGSKPPAE